MVVPKNLPNNYDLRLKMINDEGEFYGKFFFEVEETKDRLLEEENEAPFEWTVRDMTATSMEFELRFSDPANVSQDKRSPDQLSIEFISDIFKSQSTDKRLSFEGIDG
jgi:hypothetical protein